MTRHLEFYCLIPRILHIKLTPSERLGVQMSLTVLSDMIGVYRGRDPNRGLLNERQKRPPFLIWPKSLRRILTKSYKKNSRVNGSKMEELIIFFNTDTRKYLLNQENFNECSTFKKQWLEKSYSLFLSLSISLVFQSVNSPRHFELHDVSYSCETCFLKQSNFKKSSFHVRHKFFLLTIWLIEFTMLYEQFKNI